MYSNDVGLNGRCFFVVGSSIKIMGMFNSIYADLLCPDKRKISKDVEIQIKWQKYEARILAVYHLGDILEDIEDEYDNNWIRTDYICNICSKYTNGHKGTTYIKTEDQKRHYVFIEIENARICKILTEEEFPKQGVKTFVNYW
ncbi:MAG: hypothetical protein ABII25_09770 [bacterium]